MVFRLMEYKKGAFRAEDRTCLIIVERDAVPYCRGSLNPWQMAVALFDDSHAFFLSAEL